MLQVQEFNKNGTKKSSYSSPTFIKSWYIGKSLKLIKQLYGFWLERNIDSGAFPDAHNLMRVAVGSHPGHQPGYMSSLNQPTTCRNRCHTKFDVAQNKWDFVMDHGPLTD